METDTPERSNQTSIASSPQISVSVRFDGALYCVPAAARQSGGADFVQRRHPWPGQPPLRSGWGQYVSPQRTDSHCMPPIHSPVSTRTIVMRSMAERNRPSPSRRSPESIQAGSDYTLSFHIGLPITKFKAIGCLR